jgi:ribosomal protein L11 methyltransferase
MLELFPDGYEEVEHRDGVELIAYTDASGEERIRHVFGGAHGRDVAAGWETRWRDFHRPVRVGPLWIGPPWEEPVTDATMVVIDPGRAFGTGAHATTRLCVELLLEVPRGSVIDVGCGSGVLAIAAARLGHRPVVAVDIENGAVDATRANAAANHVDIDVYRADAASAALPAADLALMNISLAVDLAAAPRLDVHRVIASGFLAAEHPALPGFRVVARREAEGWAANLLERSHKRSEAGTDTAQNPS